MPTTYHTTRYNRISMPSGQASAIRGLPELRSRLKGSTERLKELIRELLEETRVKWLAEAMHRVPFDVFRDAQGQHLRESIETAIEEIGDTLYAAIGTNNHYASYVEFGTHRIAQGRVLALGDGPEVTDAQAVKDWPAKDARGGGPEQMPWLRPSWWVIEPWFREQLQLCMLIALRGGSRT